MTPSVNQARGPGRRTKGTPFYNPAMALNRDLSVLAADAEAIRKGREIDVADALAGTGARALRIAKECNGALVVHANDANPHALAALHASEARNALAPDRLMAHLGDAHAFLASHRFDVVDLDPHGSPMPFVDAAVRATRTDGLLCATATDTGALAGKFPRACLRRYGAHHGLHGAPWRAEVGLRILAGALVRAAARFERAATPLLSVQQGHWMRVFVRIGEGSRAADDAIGNLRMAAQDDTGAGSFLPRPPEGRPWAGPLWAGALHDADFVAALGNAREGKALACPKEVDALLATVAAEAGASPFWVVPDHLQKRLGPPPRRDILATRLSGMGIGASRTHMDPQGVRTDATLAQLRQAWQAGASVAASGGKRSGKRGQT